MTDEPQVDIDKIVADRFGSLPRVVQDAITSADVEKRLRELSENHKLHIDQWQILENEVMLTLLGIQDVTELGAELSTELNITAEDANSLATDINTIVFEPIRQELERSLESPEAKEKELTPEEIARQQILAASGDQATAPTATAGATATSPTPPVIGTPPQPPPTQKVVRAPLSGAYTARQPSSERKAVDGDPYREPPK